MPPFLTSPLTVLAVASALSPGTLPGHPAGPIQAPTQRQEVFEMVELAPDVWAAVVQPRPPAYAFANSLVVVSDSGVLVVDTQQSPRAAEALIREIESLTDAPVRWVVNTHWHGDHVWGNQAYSTRWPEVNFVSHRGTREHLEALGRSEVEAALQSLPDRVAQREEWLETGRGPDGQPLTPEQVEAVRYSRDVNRAYLEDLEKLHVILPNVFFDDRLTLQLGSRRVELVHVGPSHTEGDLVVWLPEERIVAVGDLIEAGLPFVEHADFRGWARALEEVEAMDPALILGSHASPEQGIELLHWQGDFFRTLTDEVEMALGRGSSPDEALGEIDLGGFQESFLALGVDADALEAWLADAVQQAASQLQPDQGG